MAGRKTFTLVIAIFFLLLGLAGLYRLLVGIPITIGGVHIGQVISFFVFVVCVALSMIFFRKARATS